MARRRPPRSSPGRPSASSTSTTSRRQSGALTREQAQTQAADRIEQLRWGDENQDYFWITDMHPTMIMHPYLPELDGQDLTTYRGQGRQPPVRATWWTWSRRAAPGSSSTTGSTRTTPTASCQKLSYVRGVHSLAAGSSAPASTSKTSTRPSPRCERNLIYVSIAIVVLVALLLLYSRPPEPEDREEARGWPRRD